MPKVSKDSSIFMSDRESRSECSVVVDAEAPERDVAYHRQCVRNAARHAAAPTTRDVRHLHTTL